jgi:hypothetical protein
LVALKREPDIPRDALAGTVVGVERWYRLTIDRDRILARARRASRIDKNVRDIRAIGYDVETCSAAVSGERKTITCPGETGDKSHHSEQRKPSESFHKHPFTVLACPSHASFPETGPA